MSRLVLLFIATIFAQLITSTPLYASGPLNKDAGFTSIFSRYYGSIQKERWKDAWELLHERLKKATAVHTPEDLAQRNRRTQLELIQAFQQFDHLEVAKVEVDLTSITGQVAAEGDGNILGQITYDLVVFPVGTGAPLMYRVVMDAGLSGGQIIRMTQRSMTRIDPGGMRDAV